MKVVFTTSGDTLDSPLDDRFGRAPKFLVYDLDSETFEVVDNAQNLNAPQGAGVQAAEAVARTGAGAVVTGNCGPRAFQVLSASGIKVYTSPGGTVSQALEEFKAGRLKPTDSANVPGHWA